MVLLHRLLELLLQHLCYQSLLFLLTYISSKNHHSSSESHLEKTEENFQEILYILIKCFESKKMTQENIVDQIIQPIFNNLHKGQEIEVEFLFNLIVKRILTVLNCEGNEKDGQKISFVLSVLFENANGELNTFIESFIDAFAYMKIYSPDEENDYYEILRKIFEVDLKYFKEEYKDDYISFYTFRNLLNVKDIELEDRFIEFLIYKMKQFSSKKNKSIFDLSYNN